MDRIFAVLATGFMFLGVAAGAFGAHALSDFFASRPEIRSTYDTAVRYQLIHGLALMSAAWVAGRWPGTLANIAGVLFVVGIIVFSGSLYLLTLTGLRWLGAITPLGGAAFLLGWLLLGLAIWSN